ncbi:MAG: ATP-binding protein [Salinirussus sp.]
MRLRTKYALVLLTIMVVLGGVVLGSTELFKQQTIAQEQAELNRTTTLTAGQIKEQIDEQRRKIANLAFDPDMAEFENTREQLRIFVNSSEFFAAQVIAPNGTIVDFRGQITDPESVIGRDVSDRTSFQQALDGNVYIERPERIGNSSIYVVAISVPLNPAAAEETGGPTADGVLTGAIRVGTAEGGQVGAASSGVLGPIDSLRRSTQTATVRARADSGETAVLRPADREFEQALSSTAAIDPDGLGSTWELTVTRDRAALTERLRTLQLIQGGSLFVVLLSMVGLGVWQYRTNLRQTERLLEGFGALTQGRFDYELSLSSAQEWQQISDGFNDLGTGLRQREAAIQERERRLSVLNRVLRHNVQNDLSVVQGYLEVLPDMPGERQSDLAEKGLAKTRKLVAHSTKAKQMDKAMDSADEGLVELDAVGSVVSVCSAMDGEYPDATITVDAPDEELVWAISALEYAIESLVENACEHVEEPTIEVTVTRDDDTVAITVADDGPGIPENEQDVLAKEEETDLEHGSGVGLWLVQLVVEKSEGELVFGDQSDGGRATIELAAATVEKEDLAPATAAPV